MFGVQAAIQHAIQSGHLIYAGWFMLATGLVMALTGVIRKQDFKVGYWRMTVSLLILGITAMSGLLSEGLAIIAKLIGAGQ